MFTITEPVKVDRRHIPYIEVLWKALEDSKDTVGKREEYLRTSTILGIKTASTDRVARLPDRATLRKEERTLERIKTLLSLGAEPVTPPSDWWCGTLTSPKKAWHDWPTETWPCLHDRYEMDNTVRIYRGAFPIEAMQRYARMKPYVDDVRVYSPERSDFKKAPLPVLRDPVLIGMIRYLETAQYFELARWDIDKDLAKVFGG